MTESQPRYTHDCTECVFLGRYGPWDLYADVEQDTVVARRSSEGSDYLSGRGYHHDPLATAEAWATARGVLTPRPLPRLAVPA